MQLGYQVFTSPMGEILVAGTSLAVTHVAHGTDKAALSATFLMQHDNASAFGRSECVSWACEQIVEYLEGRRRSIDVAIQADGTELQRKVWQELRRIPYGTTTSYTQIAEAISEPQAVRPVANACGSNPIPIIVPCHRVIHKNGNVSGFAWGKEAKQFLLDLEKESVAV